MLNLLTVGIFVGVAILVFITAEIVRRSFSPARRRLRELSDSEMAPHLPHDDHSPLRDALAAQVPQHARGKSEIQKELLQAGYFRPSALPIYLALRNGLMLAALIATGSLVVMVGPERETLVWRILLVGLGLTIVMWALPRLVLKLKANSRVDRITHSLPFALDMVTMCLSGGAAL